MSVLKFCLYSAVIASSLFICGCVERRLTIVTQPSQATVWLNDEEVGTTPVTVNFKWYGEYRIRIEKAGYTIVNAHKNLPRPLHDYMPFDFITECLWPWTIHDSYAWSFDLSPYTPISSPQLIDDARNAESRFDTEIEQAKQQVQESLTGKKTSNKK